MKQILLTVAMLAIVFTAGAQNKDQLLSSIEKAEAATQNEKKASNPNTWIKYGDALTKAYETLVSTDYRVGWSAAEVAMFNTQMPLSSEQKEVNGVQYQIDHYAFRDLYYNLNTQVLDAIIITQPISDDNLLAEARDAYLKAAELDAKGSKTKILTEKLMNVQGRFIEYASGNYALGNYELAAENFENSLSCVDNPVINKIDTMMVYNTGLMYNAVGNNEKAKTYYTQCIELGYDANGEISSSLASILMAEGDIEGAKACLNAAFQKYPASQSVLVALINLYIESNDDPQKILALIQAAQKNEPDNATLVYAEGNVYFSTGDFEKAIEYYQKSYDMDSTYVFGIYAVGNTYFEMAVDVQDEMDKLDLRDVEGYEKLLAEFEQDLMNAIDPLETAFAMTDDQDVKIASASALKQIYFRFRDKDPKYAEQHAKYETFLNSVGITE